MSDCRFGVSPVNYPDSDPEKSIRKVFYSMKSQWTELQGKECRKLHPVILNGVQDIAI